MKFEFPSSKKTRKSYSLEFKLNVVEKAKKSNNSQAGLAFSLNEKLVRNWRKDEMKIKEILASPMSSPSHKQSRKTIERQSSNCQYCNKKYKSKLKLKEHLKLGLYDEDEPHITTYFTCKTCKFSTQNRDEFSDHYKSIDGLKIECLEGGFSVISDCIVHSKRQYECDKCDSKFGRIKNLIEHKTILHGRSYACQLCRFVTNIKTKLWYHAESNHPNSKDEAMKIVKCNLCTQKFEFKRELRYHKIKIHNDKENWLKCDICDTKVRSKSQLKHHIDIEHKEKAKEAYNCEICSKKLSCKSALQLHILNQHETKPVLLQCDICGSRHKNNRLLMKHQSSVHLEDNLMCDICDRGFTTQMSLTNHKYTHSGRKLKCDMCDFETANPTGLKVHQIQRHENLKKFKCDECGKAFNLKPLLQRHQRAIHEKDQSKSHKCKACDFSTFYESNLVRHIQLHHGPAKDIQVKCNICNITLKTKTGLKEHTERLHQEKLLFCDQCDFGPCIRKDLLSHLRSGYHKAKKTSSGKTKTVYNKTPHFCEECGKSFSRKDKVKRHWQSVHTKEKPFKCDICPYDSARRDKLTKHLRTVHSNKKP